MCSCTVKLMFETAREDLSRVVVAGLSRSGLESLVAELSSLESSAHKAKKSARTATKLASMPKTREKLAQGMISEEHADAVAGAAETVDDAGAADEALSGTAERLPADLFEKKAKEWADRNRADAGEDAHARQRRHRHLRRFEGDHGAFAMVGATDSTEGKQLWDLIESETDSLWRDDGGRDSVDKISSRTGDQRRWDALVGLVKRGAGMTPAAAVGKHVKAPPPKYQGCVVIPVERYLDGPASGARAELIGSGPLPDSVFERMRCDMALAALIVNADGDPLWMGRQVLTATPAQWRALIVRDRGCVVCGADPSRCAAHHIRFWEDHGDPDITNLVLLCVEHHHLLHKHELELVTHDGIAELRPREGPARNAWPHDRPRARRRRTNRSSGKQATKRTGATR